MSPRCRTANASRNSCSRAWCRRRRINFSADSDRVESRIAVVAGLVPATPNVETQSKNNRGGRDKPGHDRRERAEQPMSKFSLICITASLLAAIIASWPALAAEGTKHEGAPIPNFAPDSTTAWTLNRPAHDDFLPPPSGPGPVLSDKAHPYVPNGQ